LDEKEEEEKPVKKEIFKKPLFKIDRNALVFIF
jgi:hypothetical protein